MLFSLQILIRAILTAFVFFRLQKKAKAAADVDYPAYGITGEFPYENILGLGDAKRHIRFCMGEIFHGNSFIELLV